MRPGTDSGAPGPLEVPGVPCVQGNRTAGPRPTLRCPGSRRPGEQTAAPAPLEEPRSRASRERRATYSSTSRLGTASPVAQNSPIIWPAQALRCSRKCGHPHRRAGHEATLDEVLTPFSGFLGDGRDRPPAGRVCPRPLRLRGTLVLSQPESTTRHWDRAQAPCPAWASEGSYTAALPSTRWPPEDRLDGRHPEDFPHGGSAPTPPPPREPGPPLQDGCVNMGGA